MSNDKSQMTGTDSTSTDDYDIDNPITFSLTVIFSPQKVITLIPSINCMYPKHTKFTYFCIPASFIL